tara:strand:- start:141 stop:686 length:546 start_codon:yes stop_codon:yes gene_type:complete
MATSQIQAPSGAIVGRKPKSNFLDIILQAGEFQGQEGVVFLDSVPELRTVDYSKIEGKSININRVRAGNSKIISNALPWSLQPKDLQAAALEDAVKASASSLEPSGSDEGITYGELHEFIQEVIPTMTGAPEFFGGVEWHGQQAQAIRLYLKHFNRKGDAAKELLTPIVRNMELIVASMQK